MSQEDILKSILSVARETSFAGAGLSLKQALSSIGYISVRKSFSTADLVPILHANPSLIEEWLRYSQDKRTEGGYYLLPSKRIGQVSNNNPELRFSSMEEATAEYVVRELDFWARLNAAG